MEMGSQNQNENQSQNVKNLLDLAIDKALCERSLFEFVKMGWSSADPSEFVEDWYLEIICRALEDIYFGKTKRLIINIPPRCSKSTICCIFFPVWCWLKEITTKILTGSYSREIAIRDTVRSRYLIDSLWFQEHWKNLINFSSDQNQKSHYTNIDRGERFSFSVGGPLTGMGSDIIILDDPINVANIYSQTIRETCNSWFSEALTTRLNDPKQGKIIIIMQRLHQNDLTGYLLESGKWDHLNIPMRYEGNKKIYRFRDPRKKEGDILTERHDEKSLKKLEADLGSFGTASQLQQRPSPKEGGYIKYEWFREYIELPHVQMYTWSWDTAIKDKAHNDYSVGTLWAWCEDGYYLIDMWRKKMQWPELEMQLRIQFDGFPSSEVLIEDKSSGQQLLQKWRKEGVIPIIAMMPGKDMLREKGERLKFVSSLFEAGKIKFPKRKPWLKDVINELTNFPNANHDDIVDSISQYLSRRLNERVPRVRRV